MPELLQADELLPDEELTQSTSAGHGACLLLRVRRTRESSRGPFCSQAELAVRDFGRRMAFVSVRSRTLALFGRFSFGKARRARREEALGRLEQATLHYVEAGELEQAARLCVLRADAATDAERAARATRASHRVFGRRSRPAAVAFAARG